MSYSAKLQPEPASSKLDVHSVKIKPLSMLSPVLPFPRTTRSLCMLLCEPLNVCCGGHVVSLALLSVSSTPGCEPDATLRCTLMRLLLCLEIVEQDAALLRLLTPILDHHTAAVDDLSCVAFAIDLACRYSLVTRRLPSYSLHSSIESTYRVQPIHQAASHRAP